MADVRDRGQLILILGLLVAVMFVVLALFLNTVIFTENLASRGTDPGGRDAIEHRRVVVDGVGDLIDEENANDYGTNASVRGNVTDGIDEIDRLLRLRRAERGTAVDISNTTLHNGSVLRQNDSDRNMTASSPTEDWILARDINDTRNFALNVTGGLNSTTDPDNAFRVDLDNGSHQWTVAIYENDTTGEVEVAVNNGSTFSGWSKEVCDPPTSTPVTLNLTGGTVGGEECSALQFGKGITPPYDIWYVKSNQSQGTYNLTVNISGPGQVETFNFNDPGNGQPYFARAVYSVSLDVYYQNEQLTYRASVRIAPGEPS